MYVDGKKTETHPVPVSYRTRSNELCWNYDLPKGKHSVEIKIANPSADHKVNLGEAIIYADHPVDGIQANMKAAGK